MVTGKERERNAFFPFTFKYFLGAVYNPFIAKIMKNGCERRQNGEKRLERS